MNQKKDEVPIGIASTNRERSLDSADSEKMLPEVDSLTDIPEDDKGG